MVNEAPSPKLSENAFLRREAGEGWHPGGLDTEVLDQIIIREELLDKMVKDNQYYPGPIRTACIGQFALVHQLKEEKNIGRPPLPNNDA